MEKYINTLIQVAPDCPRKKGTPPVSATKSLTTLEVRYDVLNNNPYKFTYDEFLREVFINRLGRDEADLNFDSRTLRRSRLCKQWGWGIHGDEFGRLALVGCETPRYKQLQNHSKIKKINCSRNRR